MLISEIESWNSYDLLKYDKPIRIWINDIRTELLNGIDVSLAASAYLSISNHLSNYNTSEDKDLLDRLSEIRTLIIDAGGASYLSEDT